jgi:serine/threonine protein kinase
VPASLTDHTRYRVLELIGVGGMGAVYKAEHQLMERAVALKVINPNLVDSPSTVERFRREVKAAARLAHPNIVTAFDAEQAGGSHFLVMEFVEGTSLGRLVADRGPLPVAQACDYIHQASLGLQHAFERGMVHRDIKPQNLMLTPGGQVKVLDFGLARFALEQAPTGGLLASLAAPQSPEPAAGNTASDSLTQTGAVMGTPDFLAPEQALDAHQADVRADVYSLGCTLYFLLTGQVPFPDGGVPDKLTAHRERAPTPLAELRRDIPPALGRVVDRMMAKDPAKRYQTPAAVAAALAPFVPGAIPPRSSTRRILVAAAAAFVLLLGGTVAIWAWIRDRAANELVNRDSAPEPPPAVGPGPVTAPPKVGAKRQAPRGQGVPEKYRESIDRGLTYLVRTQAADGHWEADGGNYPITMTALAGMALLMEGSTTSEGKYAEPIRKAADWLIARSRPNGLLSHPADTMEVQRYMFGHGYAMLFLASVYSQEEDGDRRQKLGALLTKAVEFTDKAQTTRGGWGYVRATESVNFDEGATTIVQLQGLRAARNSGIVVPKKLIDIDYLRRCTTAKGGVIYSMTNGGDGDRPPITAAALACMLTAGEYDSDLARKWLGFCKQSYPIDKPMPKVGHDEFAHYYYAQALYVLGDRGYAKMFPGSKPAEQVTWSKYRELMFPLLQSLQTEDGSWRKEYIGPVYGTACALTILQLDNGALQIYQR